MHFLATILLTLTPVAVLAAPAIQESHSALKEGTFYITTVYDNGTLVHEELDNLLARAIIQRGDGPAISARTEGPANHLNKRFVDCWGRNLDKYGTDKAVDKWKEYLANQNLELTSGGKTKYSHYTSDGVRVYYCINGPNKVGNLNLEDFNYALAQMDASCRRYEASYYRWDGTVEIVGKASVNDAVGTISISVTCCTPHDTVVPT